MTPLEAVLVFAGIPLAILGVLALASYAADLRRRPRYRPGQGWNVAPVWWVADPDATRGGAGAQSPPSGDGEPGGARGTW